LLLHQSPPGSFEHQLALQSGAHAGCLIYQEPVQENVLAALIICSWHGADD